MRFETDRPTAIKFETDPPILGVEVDPKGDAAKAWDEYIGESPYLAMDRIIEIWADPEITDPVIRQRAVTVITSPADNDIELPFPGPYPAHRHGHVSRLAEGNPYLIKEYAAGMMFWIDCIGERRGPQERVSAQIKNAGKMLFLMANSDEAICKKVFEYYPLGDPEQFRYRNLHYGNLKHLIAAESIPDEYKRTAIDQFKDIVIEEAAITEMVEGVDYKDTAIVNMAELIDDHRFSSSIPIETREEIAAFLEANWPSHSHFLEDSTIRQLFEQLQDDELRFKLAYRNIAPPPIDEHHLAFEIFSPEDLAMVEWVRAEAEKHGFKFEERARVLIDGYYERQARSRQREERSRELINRLRRLG
jgi:hypothetical protein